METFLEQVFNGVSQGSILLLIALGLIAYGAFWCVRAYASRLAEP